MIIVRLSLRKNFVTLPARAASTHAGGDYSRPSILKRLWNSWVPIPTGVGLTLLAVLQWRRLQRERNKDLTLNVAKNWEISCYKAIPLRSLSRTFGWLASTYVPYSVRPMVYTSYAKIFGVNLNEVAEPLECYDCLCSFFTRKLLDGCRPIDQECLVSPADGLVVNAGKLSSCQIEQVKGVTYSVKAFLGDVTWDKPISSREEWERFKSSILQNQENDLYQCVVYLAPGDYHRFHSPVEFNVHFRRHFQGELLSVNPRMAGWIPGLFTLNERAVYTGLWEKGFFSMTAVGATNVGSIRVYSDQALHTNEKKWKSGINHKEAKLDCAWPKGAEVGEFRMGSTIVLIWEGPRDLTLAVRPGDRVRVGQALCSSASLPSRASG